MTYGRETRLLLVDVGLKFKRADMQMIRWMCSMSMKDRSTNEELRRMVGVEPFTAIIRSGRLRWYGHGMRKGDEDWMKKCMELTAEFEIDKEDVHDRKKWRRNVMKRKSNPIGKRTINR